MPRSPTGKNHYGHKSRSELGTPNKVQRKDRGEKGEGTFVPMKNVRSRKRKKGTKRRAFPQARGREEKF